MILAGDVGGTKTLLGLFENTEGRPRAIALSAFATLDHDSLPAVVAAFARKTGVPTDAVSAACFGVAGPVIDGNARLTNVPWRINTRDVADRFGWSRVMLLNDLEAMSLAIPVLRKSELHVLQRGEPRPDGHMALIAAGTGLGEAFLAEYGGLAAAGWTDEHQELAILDVQIEVVDHSDRPEVLGDALKEYVGHHEPTRVESSSVPDARVHVMRGLWSRGRRSCALAAYGCAHGAIATMAAREWFATIVGVGFQRRRGTEVAVMREEIGRRRHR
jgi:Glucokinase